MKTEISENSCPRRAAHALVRRVVLVSLLATTTAGAVPLTFFGEDLGPLRKGDPLPNAAAAEAAFLGHLVGVGTEDFEAIAVGTSSPLVLTFGAAGTATLSGDGTLRNDAPTSPEGRFPVSGDRYWGNVRSANFSIAFSDPIAAFGFYATDAGDFRGQLTLTLQDGSSTVVTIPNTVNAPNASAIYFGYIDTARPFVGIQFGSTSDVDFFGFDDMTIGTTRQVMPIADRGSAAAALAFAVAGLSVARRRWNA